MAGRMNVQMVVHGGPAALLDVMEGLVTWNAKALRKGMAPKLDAARHVRYVASPTWLDAPAAAHDGIASAGTLAAWRAAELRNQYNDPTVRVGLVSGVPVVLAGTGSERRLLEDPSEGRGRTMVQPIVVGSDGDRVTEYLMVTIDDRATSVEDIGDSMARHNAKLITARGLPPLYDSGVKYKTEDGEFWWDAQEIVNNGFDDCEGLSAYRAGEILAAGGEAAVVTRLITVPNAFMGGGGGGRLFHAIVRARDRDGKMQYDDPSARLGMPSPTWHAEQLRKERKAGAL